MAEYEELKELDALKKRTEEEDKPLPKDPIERLIAQGLDPDEEYGIVREIKNPVDPFAVIRFVVPLGPSVCNNCGFDAAEPYEPQPEWFEDIEDYYYEYENWSYAKLSPDEKKEVSGVLKAHKKRCAKSQRILTRGDIAKRGKQYNVGVQGRPHKKLRRK